MIFTSQFANRKAPFLLFQIFAVDCYIPAHFEILDRFCFSVVQDNHY